MRAPISIVIPTLDSGPDLVPAAESLLEGVRCGLVRNLVVADGGSEDDTEAIAESIGAEFVASAPGRGTQLTAGARAATGSWLLFLHADTRLEPGWSAAAERHMRDFPAQAGYFRLKFRARGLPAAWVAGWANARSRVLGLPYGDQGMLISRRLFNACGGYPEIPIMEDVEIARRLKGKLRKLDATATTDPSRYVADGWLARGARNIATLVKYELGAAPESLARSYSRD